MPNVNKPHPARLDEERKLQSVFGFLLWRDVQENALFLTFGGLLTTQPKQDHHPSSTPQYPD